VNTGIVWLAMPDPNNPLRFKAMDICNEGISSWSNESLDIFQEDTIWVQSFEQLNQVKILLAIGMSKLEIEATLHDT